MIFLHSIPVYMHTISDPEPRTLPLRTFVCLFLILYYAYIIIPNAIHSILVLAVAAEGFRLIRLLLSLPLTKPCCCCASCISIQSVPPPRCNLYCSTCITFSPSKTNTEPHFTHNPKLKILPLSSPFLTNSLTSQRKRTSKDTQINPTWISPP